MRQYFFLWLIWISPSLSAQELPCAQAASAYQYGARVGEDIVPVKLNKNQYQQIHRLFNTLARKPYRKATLEDFYCKQGERHPEHYTVKSWLEYDYEGLLFIRGESLSSGQSVKQFELLRLKLLADTLLLWGIVGGTGVELIESSNDKLVYREVRRTRKPTGGFTERDVVTEIRLKARGFTIEERFYIKGALYSWRFWRY